MALKLIWSLSGNAISSVPFPVAFPGVMGNPEAITLTTSAVADTTYENLASVKFFLEGPSDQVNLLLNVWPYYGNQPGAVPQPSLNGGLEISFDNGANFHRFGLCPLPQCNGARHGDPSDPRTWLILPEVAIAPSAPDGNLGAFSSASMLLRYNIPAQATQYQVLHVRLEAAFDVV